MQRFRVGAIVSCVILALVGSLWFLAGCAGADIEGVWCADAFSAESLRQDGLLVAGVVDATSETEETDVAMGKWLAGIFRDRLNEGKAHVSARDSEVLAQQVGPERYAAFMDEYRSEGQLCAASLAALAQSGVKDRYIFLARVVGNEVSNSQKSEYDKEAKAVKITKMTHRTVEVIAHVFDLESGTLAWRAQARAGGLTSVSFHEENEDSGLLEKVFDAVLGSETRTEPDYPEPLQLDITLRPVLEDLAKELKET
jgi:hypothetical protein